MSSEKLREVARKGGTSVPDEKRAFFRDRALAAEAGRKGGKSVRPHQRTFTQDRDLAAQAGRKGGQEVQKKKMLCRIASISGSSGDKR